MALEVREKRASWICVAPVQNVILTDAIDHELQIDRVTLVSYDNLPYRRRRFGFPQRISELRDRMPRMFEHFFGEVETVAIQRLTGTPDDIEEQFLQTVRDELAIVALSRMGLARRHSRAAPMLANERPAGDVQYMMVDDSDAAVVSSGQVLEPMRPLEFDQLWRRRHEDWFFFDLLEILRGETKLSSSWGRDLRNAAVLAGQSQASNDLPQAFLWNMIVIELLLTHSDGGGGRYKDKLPDRAEAFLGWSGDWTTQQFRDRIGEVYGKRNDLVHQGLRDAATIEDLFFTDDLVLNLFHNIVNHIDMFPHKNAVIEFSEKVEAEQLLGIEPEVRPDTLQLISPQYTKRDYEKLRLRR